MDILRQNEIEARRGPRPLQNIAWVLKWTFYLSIILIFVPLISLVMDNDESLNQVTWSSLFFMMFLPLLAPVFSYIILIIANHLVKGSIRAYYILLIFYLLQILGYQSGDFELSIVLIGIPITIEFFGFVISFNILAIIIVSLLLKLKNQYPSFFNRQ